VIYSIQIKKSAQKSLAKISCLDQEKIIIAIHDLGNDPRPLGCKKLSGRDAWRIRVGDYRVIYEIKNSELFIVVILVGHHSDIYKKH
jgi:mRNA interferase RelE/StbE